MEPAKAEEVKSPRRSEGQSYSERPASPPWSPKLFLEARARNLRNHPRAAPATEAKKPSEAPTASSQHSDRHFPCRPEESERKLPSRPVTQRPLSPLRPRSPREPAKTEEAKSPAGQKAKTTQEVTKPTRESKGCPRRRTQEAFGGAQASSQHPGHHSPCRPARSPRKFPSRPVTQRPLPPLRRRSQRKRPNCPATPRPP